MWLNNVCAEGVRDIFDKEHFVSSCINENQISDTQNKIGLMSKSRDLLKYAVNVHFG